MNEIISYVEMCRREGASLQRGMNFRHRPTYSVLLMSTRINAPYRDIIDELSGEIIYEGHDVPRSKTVSDPKLVDQVLTTGSDTWTENGRFFEAARKYKEGEIPPERVRVYEKIRQGIWAFNGAFHLIDAWGENDGIRNVYKFRLKATGEIDEVSITNTGERSRLIPTPVKLEVWKRDVGRCVVCGATDELDFDHIIPYSKGGSSDVVDNIQILCARHNLAKRDRIE